MAKRLWPAHKTQCATHINDLPIDCLQQIFNRIGSPPLPLQSPSNKSRPSWLMLHNPLIPSGVSHPLHCTLVCTRWQSATNDAIHSLYFDFNAKISEATIQNFSRFHHLSTLILHGCKLVLPHSITIDTFLCKLASATPPLQHLTLLCVKVEGTCGKLGLPGALAKALPAWRNLQKLTIEDLFLESEGLLDLLASIACCPSLHELCIDHVSRLLRSKLPLSAVCEKLGQVTCLRKLHLAVSEVPPAVLPKLTSLRLADLALSDLAATALEGLKGLTQLEVLRCQNLERLPGSLGSITGLLRLVIDGSVALGSLPESLGGLTQLNMLRVSSCTRLGSLPDSLGGLRELRLLEISFCESLAVLPDSLGDLACLGALSLEHCSRLRCLPACIGGLSALTSLSIRRCRTLSELPSSIGNLRHLTSLQIIASPLLRMPTSLGSLHSLKLLYLSNCFLLRRLPDSLSILSSLQRLTLTGCSALTHLPCNIGNLPNLLELDASRCCSLQELPDTLSQIPRLSYLNLDACSALKHIPKQICRLQSLTILSLRYCRSLSFLPEAIGSLQSLRSLDISGCSKVILPKSCLDLTSLEVLRMDKVGPAPFRNFQRGLPPFLLLRELWLSVGPGYQWLPRGLARLGELEVLRIQGGMWSWREAERVEQEEGEGAMENGLLFRSLKKLRGLQHLELVDCCHSLPRDLLDLRALRKLVWHATVEAHDVAANKGIVQALRGRGVDVIDMVIWQPKADKRYEMK